MIKDIAIGATGGVTALIVTVSNFATIPVSWEIAKAILFGTIIILLWRIQRRISHEVDQRDKMVAAVIVSATSLSKQTEAVARRLAEETAEKSAAAAAESEQRHRLIGLKLEKIAEEVAKQHEPVPPVINLRIEGSPVASQADVERVGKQIEHKIDEVADKPAAQVGDYERKPSTD